MKDASIGIVPKWLF